MSQAQARPDPYQPVQIGADMHIPSPTPVVGVALGALVAAAALPFGATAATASSPVADDAYAVRAGRTLTVKDGQDLLKNDPGDVDTVTSHTDPAHGTVTLAADGTFTYTPQAGFTGTDTFTYTTSEAVHLYRTDVDPLAVVGGTTITGGAWGSALVKAPSGADTYYGLTDRGPNVDGPDDDVKVEPLVDFTPSIARIKFNSKGDAVVQDTITLKAADGTPYDGQVSCEASTGETILALDGTELACSEQGYDPEGLVALDDGTFWVSDEYGPYITHFDADGYAIGRVSPYDGTLPAELALRTANRGMEGLTVTPDGLTLVGVMQSALTQADLGKAKPKKVSPVRIVTYGLATGEVHEYLYMLHDPGDTDTAVSEITALSATQFLVTERDGEVEPDAVKRLHQVDITGATDVGPAAEVAGAVYDADAGGLLVGAGTGTGTTLEALVGTAGTDAATATLEAAGVTPAASTVRLDVGALVSGLQPDGYFFGHDKIEGVALGRDGDQVVIANDSDFGIDGVTTDAAPFGLGVKTLPDGTQDDGEYLAVDLAEVQGTSQVATATATVTVTVR